MKKVAIGCLIAFVIIGAAAAGITYWGYLKVKSTVATFAELGQVADIEQGVNNKSPFIAPDSRELTATQVERLVQVQKKVRDRLGAGAEAIERNYKTLLNKKDNDITDLPALLGAYKDLAHMLVDAKRAQVEALNELGMSLEEYRWVRTQSYVALGVPFVDLDFGKIAERTKNGQTAGQISLGPVTGTGPEANKKLVEKHRKTLEDNMALASFGL